MNAFFRLVSASREYRRALNRHAREATYDSMSNLYDAYQSLNVACLVYPETIEIETISGKIRAIVLDNITRKLAQSSDVEIIVPQPRWTLDVDESNIGDDGFASWLEYRYYVGDDTCVRVKVDGCIEFLSDNIGGTHFCDIHRLARDLIDLHKIAYDEFERRNGFNEGLHRPEYERN